MFWLMVASIQRRTRELHSRSGDGLDVTLLWCEDDGQCSVAVNDSRTGDAFRLEVREGENAMEVFNHPYAYAAWHGIPTAVVSRASLEDDETDVEVAA